MLMKPKIDKSNNLGSTLDNFPENFRNTPTQLRSMKMLKIKLEWPLIKLRGLTEYSSKEMRN